MSIEFIEIRYQNILSTGNAFTTISLNKQKTTLIVGENGAGKSTILDALSFALYGKPFRKVNKPQLLNSINQKDLVVELDFNIGRDRYMIRRGIKPNIFEVYRNDTLLNQDGANRDYQSYLEQNILKLSFKSFGQIVVLGSSTFVPFMQLPAAHRREIIEDLLDIQIFTKMNVLLKERISQNKNDLQNIKYTIDLVTDRISSANKHNDSIQKMKQADVVKINGRILELVKENGNILEEYGSISLMQRQLKETIQDENDVNKKYMELVRLDKNLRAKIKEIAKELKFYEDNNECPICKQGIAHDHKTNIVTTRQNKISDIENGLQKMGNELDSIEKRKTEISTIHDKINMFGFDMSGKTATHASNERNIIALTAELTNAKKEAESIDTTTIEALLSELEVSKDEHRELTIDRDTMGVVANLLKDGGIKTQIIRQYVPIINKLINKYLADMDFFVQFELDEQFNETIRSRFRDEFSYESFSEGEKMRIDLALLFTWRAVSKLRNSVSTNLLIMDEVFDGSLDANGTEEFMKILTDITGDSNVFVISHKTDQLIDKFDNTLRFEKVKNFSRIAA
jgi:DNA repair exonuclease SbcCD ATPase subunit